MINIDTYISILFSILIASLLGSYITIFTQNFSRFQKRKMVIVVSVITVFLLILLTIIYCYGRYDFKIFLPSFSTSKSFDISNLLPFNKLQFLNVSFSNLYCNNICISVGLFVVGYILMVYLGSIIFDKKHLLLTSVITIFIVSYLRLWEIYITCVLFYNHTPIWLSYIAQTVIYLLFTTIELTLLDEINSRYYLKDIPLPVLKKYNDKLQNALHKLKSK